MGRRKGATHMKKAQVSISLPNHLIERIDLMTSRRSQWIHRAITARIDGEEGIEVVSTRRLLAILMNRLQGDLQKEAIIKAWFDEELPDSGV